MANYYIIYYLVSYYCLSLVWLKNWCLKLFILYQFYVINFCNYIEMFILLNLSDS